MTESRYTLTDMSGRFQLSIEMDPDYLEPMSHTCRRAFDDLTARGLIPADALITDMNVGPPVAFNTVMCTVSWTQGKPLLAEQNLAREESDRT